jgi:hypothetical protein
MKYHTSDLVEARRKTLFILYRTERGYRKPGYFGNQTAFGFRIIFAIATGVAGLLFVMGMM